MLVVPLLLPLFDVELDDPDVAFFVDFFFVPVEEFEELDELDELEEFDEYGQTPFVCKCAGCPPQW